jgi:hypothetical protein
MRRSVLLIGLVNNAPRSANAVIGLTNVVGGITAIPIDLTPAARSRAGRRRQDSMIRGMPRTYGLQATYHFD